MAPHPAVLRRCGGHLSGLPCRHCAHCKRGYENICRNQTAIGYEIDGAFAEYSRIPASAVLAGKVSRLLDHLSWKEAALIEPRSCVLNGQELIDVGISETVVILGCGPIGLVHTNLRACPAPPASSFPNPAPSALTRRSRPGPTSCSILPRKT